MAFKDALLPRKFEKYIQNPEKYPKYDQLDRVILEALEARRELEGIIKKVRFGYLRSPSKVYKHDFEEEGDSGE